MLSPRNTDPNPEPFKSKNTRYKVILKLVLAAVAIAWRVYRVIAKVIDFVKEYLN